ncbi:MAG TPA: NADH-quinone oxidoreductase subunit M [Bacteriovoracaceae bacterium]|nr:NADH-quinone oxidoreductase subunit M [Bacteriovoracaceae bacterium]
MQTNSYLLTWIIFTPLLFAFVALLVPKSLEKHLRTFTLIQTLVSAVIATMMYMNFDGLSDSGQMVHLVPWLPQWGINYLVSIDGISLPLVMLTAFVSPLAILGTWPHGELKKEKFFVCLLMCLQTGMYGTFLASDIFLFYFFWEVVLIPMFFMIGIWGGKERIYATIKFFLYTMVGSLLMLVAIFWLIKTSTETLGMPVASYSELSKLQFAFDGSSLWSALTSPQTLLFMAFALAFVIKVPMVPFHTWLPDAHVQAPTVGSVFLAAVLLKLGTYGLMRIAIPFFPEAAYYFSEFFIIMGVIGIIYGAFCALAQSDFKKLVAYSSVSHMGFIMVGLFSFQKVAIAGSLYQMINHGISAGGLFLIVGFLYERLHTRNLNEFGGLSKVVPVMAIAFMVMTLSSIAMPGSNGFVGEFPILLGTFMVQPVYVMFAGTGVILGAIYALKAYQLVMLGPKTRSDLDHLHDLNMKEVLAMGILTIFVFGIGFFPRTFFGKSDATLNTYSTQLVEKAGQYGSR